ncbi:MAG: PEGA domain-containing protein [Myxococcota bacterium]
MKVVLFLALIAPPSTAFAQDVDVIRVLVRDFETLGGDAAVTTQLQQRITGAISSRSGYAVRSEKDVRELLSKQVADDPDCTSEACLQAAIKAVEARFAIYGSVGVVGGERVASITLLDGEIARPIGGASATFGSDEEMLEAAGALAGRTFDWEDAPKFTQASFKIPEDKTVKLAVMDMTGLGLDEETSRNLTTVLTGSLKQIQGADVVSQDDIRSMLELEATRQSLGCTEMSCIAEIGGALGVDRMISGSVGLMGDRYVVSLRLIDPRESKVEARVTESFVGDESQLLPAVRFSGKRLLGALGQQQGSLAVSADTSNASVFINDAESGELPMEALSGLEPGRYALRVAKNGYFDWRSDVFIEPGSATPIWVEMTERPDEWYETWWFWSAVGVVAVGAATIIILDQTAITSSDAGNAGF